MTTEKQIAANRRNANRSTGPKTHEGKIRSSRNALKHGLSAKHMMIEGEDAAEFAELHESLLELFRPKPGSETEFVRRVATNIWRLLRIPMLEANILQPNRSDRRDPRIEKIIEDDIRGQKALRTSYVKHMMKFGRDPGPEEQLDETKMRDDLERRFAPIERPAPPTPGQAQEELSKIARHEAALVKSIARGLSALVALQQMTPQTRRATMYSGLPAMLLPDGRTDPRRTRARKSASRSGNAVRSAEHIVLETEDAREFQEHYETFVEAFCPWPGAERLLVLLIATFSWRLRRVPTIEASIFDNQGKTTCRDPRVDKIIEEKVALARFCQRLARERFASSDTNHSSAKSTENGFRRTEDIHDSDNDVEQKIRGEFDKLLPSSGRNDINPAEARDLLVKISSYESALTKSEMSVIRILLALQDIRGRGQTA